MMVDARRQEEEFALPFCPLCGVRRKSEPGGRE